MDNLKTFLEGKTWYLFLNIITYCIYSGVSKVGAHTQCSPRVINI